MREVAVRGFAFAVVGVGLIVGGQSAAFASAGCTALNGTFTGGVVSGSTTGTGFTKGDIITLTVTAAGASDALGLYDATNFNVLLLSGNTVGTRTYTVAADTSANFIISGTRASAGSSFAWSCAAAATSSGSKVNTDSQKLTSVQTQGSTVAANTSAAATVGSVNNAVDQALDSQSSGGQSSATTEKIMTRDEYAWLMAWNTFGWGLFTLRPSELETVFNFYRTRFIVDTAQGFTYVWAPGTPTGYSWHYHEPGTQFAPDQRSAVAQRADEAFAALGYAPSKPVKARGTTFGFTPEWSVWSSVVGSGYNQSDSSVSKGTQINATAGLSYKLSPNAVVGAYAGFENFKYDFDTLAGSLKGNGGSIGTYVGWQLTPTLRWKGMVGWTGVSYDGSAGTASGNFTGSRWLFSTSLTGSYRVATLVVEPSASVFALTEHQTGYTDSLAVAHDARDFSTGRVSLGSKVSGPPEMMLFAGLRPYVGLYGDWGFMSDSSVPADISSRGLGAGWSARVTTGATMPLFARGTLALGGEYGGIGGAYKAWTGSARLSLPF